MPTAARKLFHTMFQAAAGIVVGCNAAFCEAQSMVCPDSIWSTWMGMASLSTVSLESRVTVSCPPSPGRKMPAGPVGSTAMTSVYCVKLSGSSGRLKETFAFVEEMARMGATRSLPVLLT